MEWNKLISPKRFGMESYHETKRDSRSDFLRDYDRLVFSAAFRRLQNKTQVFPLPGSIFVHNRLTHSLEVSCVGRSLGNNVCQALIEKHPELSETYLSEAGHIVSAACLAHDMGNPPFGHSGENAIGTFFSEEKGLDLKNRLTEEEWSDLTLFEGNANAFRLLTHQFIGRRQGGFAMTYAMLASIVKYPYSSLLAGDKKKFGFFLSEQDSFRKLADELGLIKISDKPLKYVRHPFVWLVEAADDICYQIMDIEDAYKLKILTLEETTALMLEYFVSPRKEEVEHNLAHIKDRNEKIAYLRSCVIGLLIKECTNVFIEHEDSILDGTFIGPLIDRISDTPRQAYKDCSKTAFARIYRSKQVVDVELAGYKVIYTLLELMTEAVLNPDRAYSKLLIKRVSSQYEIDSPTLYGKLLAVLDYISGMTDVYALDLYRKINGNSLPSV